MASADIGMFAAKAWSDHSIDVNAAQKARDAAASDLHDTQQNIDATPNSERTTEQWQANRENVDALNKASDKLSFEQGRTGVSNHYNELVANNIPKPVAAIRAGAHGVNQGTRALATLAKTNPALFAAVTAGTAVVGGTAAYKVGENHAYNQQLDYSSNAAYGLGA